MARRNNNRVGLIDPGTIVKYVILTIVFSLVIFGINHLVLRALAISPTGQVGNGMLTLYEVHNTGAAFNLFANQPETIVMASFIILAIILLVILTRSARLSHNAVSSMALLSSGILMNLADRLSHGYVIDYINCNFAPNIPVFNTADILIVCGALGIILSLFTRN